MTTGVSARLVARTRRVDAPHDVRDALAQLGTDGFAWIDGDRAIITSGTAVRVPAALASEALRAIDTPDTDTDTDSGAASSPTGTGPIACGALTFDNTRDAPLAIPARVLRIDGDRATLTEIEGARASAPPPWSHVPRRFVVEALQDLAAWDSAVAAALARIDDGALSKVVLAREVLVEADTALSPVDVLARLHTTQAGCFVFAASRDTQQWFVGASPELLVRRCGDLVESRPMAGTVARGATEAADALAIETLDTSPKQRAEHQLVVDAVIDALTHHCDAVVADAPEAVRLTALTHLATRIRGVVRDGSSALDIALALHPTPAVGGTPATAARDAITELEAFDRGCYAAPVGWVDAHGDGEFAVALRCAELDGPRARLLAGAGIVAGSDPDDEWAETQTKLEPMLRALVRP